MITTKDERAIKRAKYELKYSSWFQRTPNDLTTQTAIFSKILEQSEQAIPNSPNIKQSDISSEQKDRVFEIEPNNRTHVIVHARDCPIRLESD